MIQRAKQEQAGMAVEESVTEEEGDEELQQSLRARRFRDEVLPRSGSISYTLRLNPFTTHKKALQSNVQRGHSLTAPERPWEGAYMLDFERDVRVPGSINRYLREYQREGIKFLYDRWKDGAGGVLGDDMGLGIMYFVPTFTSSVELKPDLAFGLTNEVSAG